MYGDKSSEYESQTSSQCLNSRFREELMRRDGDDIFKLVPSEEDDFLNSEGIHIIPHAREGEVRYFSRQSLHTLSIYIFSRY